MSSLDIEEITCEKKVQGQSSAEIDNGNKSPANKVLNSSDINEVDKTTKEMEKQTEQHAQSCTMENLTNLTNAINEIEIKKEETQNNNNVRELVDKTLVKEVTDMKIDDKNRKNASQGYVLLNSSTNKSFNSLLAYDSNEDDDDDDSTSEESVRSVCHSTDSDESEEDENITETDGSLGAIKKKPTNKQPKTVCEMMYDKLPRFVPPENLNTSVDGKNFQHIGNVLSILDVIITIEAKPNIPAYDLDTIFFVGEDKHKKPIGQVFDIIGQVKSPMYVICMNSADDIKELGIIKGTRIYAIPESEFTHYVFLNELLKIKGSDASWMNDEEVPTELADYSDDETEHRCKSGRNSSRLQTHTKRPHGSLERYKRFERTMNKCNTINTRVHQLFDPNNSSKIKKSKKNQHQQQQQQHQQQVPQFNPLMFDPRVPPPYQVPCFPSQEQLIWHNMLNEAQAWTCPNNGQSSSERAQAEAQAYQQQLQQLQRDIQCMRNRIDENRPGPSTSK